jgi:hypothetical protein
MFPIQVRDHVLAELQKIGKENKLNSMEQVHTDDSLTSPIY